MKTPLLALTLILTAGTAPACTPEEMQAKATELVTKAQALTTLSPQEAEKLLPKLAELQGRPVTSVEDACRIYDEMLGELAAAG